MGQSFQSFKNRIMLTEILSELFDSKPFKEKFSFEEDTYGDIEIPTFLDPLRNKITIRFYKDGEGLYELDFMVNNTSFQDSNIKYNIKDYTQLLATVAKAVTEMLNKYQPIGLQIKGTDIFRKVQQNPSTIGQKDRIYAYFISQIEDKGEYMLDTSDPNAIALMKK